MVEDDWCRGVSGSWLCILSSHLWVYWKSTSKNCKLVQYYILGNSSSLPASTPFTKTLHVISTNARANKLPTLTETCTFGKSDLSKSVVLHSSYFFSSWHELRSMCHWGPISRTAGALTRFSKITPMPWLNFKQDADNERLTSSTNCYVSNSPMWIS